MAKQKLFLEALRRHTGERAPVFPLRRSPRPEPQAGAAARAGRLSLRSGCSPPPAGHIPCGGLDSEAAECPEHAVHGPGPPRQAAAPWVDPRTAEAAPLPCPPP
ncbi:unnamed protein product [Coccothraustes coccothraustes]